MRILKLKIDNPELEKQLEGFEDECEYRRLTPDDRRSNQKEFLLCDQVHKGGEFLFTSGIILTPKRKPLPEPDWSKAGMLKSGGWITIDSEGRWQYSLNSGFFSLFLTPDRYDLSWLPEVPPERFSEARWQVP